jgi:Tol biopolymer transport system component
MAVASKSALAVTASIILLVSSCQKDVNQTLPQESAPAAKSAIASVNNAKQDRKILFVSNRDGNDEIYSMNTDGSNTVRLTYNTVQDGRAAWSANGQHIAFVSGAAGARDIFVMNANGQGLRNVSNTPTADEDWVEWSPKGNSLIFSSNRDGNYEIYTSDMDGDEVVRLTYRTATYDGWGTYSPDGSRIAFQSNLGATAGSVEVFVMNADGSGITRLTNSPALDQMPAWSPDGSKIAFMSSRDGNPEIYTMNADGTNQTRLTNNGALDARPSWSREGYGISFTSARDFSLPSTLPKFEIYLMNDDGSNQRRLTNN